MALGGGCELCLHADFVQANAETYMGLVEFGVGLIPGGGGSKEFALRISDAYAEGDIELNTLKEKFLTIGMAKVSTSGWEAEELGYLKKGQFDIMVDDVLSTMVSSSAITSGVMTFIERPGMSQVAVAMPSAI